MILLDVPLALALVSLTLQLATAIAMFLIARAPGWGRVRVFGFVALSAAMYSAFDISTNVGPHDIGTLGWIMSANLAVAAVHASAWLWYTYGDETGSWKGLPVRVRRLALANVALAVILSGLGLTIEKGASSRLHVPALGIDQLQPDLSGIGNLAAALVVFTLAVSLAEYIRRARRGVPGAQYIAIGFALFGLFVVEEALVAAGVINFIYLADIGYICVVAPVTVQLIARFAVHAGRLADMSTTLAEQVQVRTHERDAAREALVEQRRLAALGALAGGVGHEINNPLQYLLFSLDELRARFGPASAAVGQDDPLENAFEGAHRIRRAVEGLRTYTRPASESFAPVDVDLLVHSAIRLASPQLRDVSAVHLELAPVAAALGDEGKLVQVLVNLLVNAAQSIRSAPPNSASAIRVATRMLGHDVVEIAIADNGPGFSSDVLPRLGEPYVTTRAREGGAGLGLFVSRGLVDSHRGELTFENPEEGGAVVSVRLPVTGPPPVSPARPSQELRFLSADSYRVLLVDDDELVGRTLARGLARLGYRVTTASDGVDALELMDAQSFDVVISDLMMPRMSGIELASALAEKHPALRRGMIVITGGAVTPAAEAFVRSSGVPVVTKPVELVLLRAEIEKSARGRVAVEPDHPQLL
ncbi:MAG: hybrid sensor histidine kinase/response regulator [bacterium]